MSLSGSEVDGTPVSSPATGKVWNILRDKVNKNNIMRRISLRKVSRPPVRVQSKIGTDIDDVEETLCSFVFSAQIFTINESNEKQEWERIIDEIAQVVLICEEEGQRSIFRVTTFDPELQGFIQSYIVIPDTKIHRQSSTFVYWKDQDEGVIWGLHFMDPDDQEQFLEICTPKEEASLEKANSSESLSNLGTPPEHLLQYESSTIKRRPKKPIQSDTAPSSPTTPKQPETPSPTKTPSSGLRKKLLGNKKQKDLKYATYSGKQRSKLQRLGYFDNLEKENSHDNTSMQDDDALNSPLSYTSESTGVSGTDKDSSKSGGSSDRIFNFSENKTPTKTNPSPVEPGVLKSAKFVEENASNFRKANSFKRQNTLPDYLESPGSDSGENLKSENQKGFARGLRNKNKDKKVKRSTSFSEKVMSRTSKHKKDNLDHTRQFVEETNTLLQDYQVQLHRQTLNETIDSGFYGSTIAENSSDASKFLLEGPPFMNAKWKNRLSAGFGSGSECSFSFLTDTGTESSAGDRDSRIESDFHENIFNEDEDDDQGDDDSLSSHHSHASMFQQRGAIRKAGWLEVKSMLVQRKKKVERAGKRSWKKYWVCLKGTMLLFHACPDKTSEESGEPRHILVVENGLAQAVPEHPKRENIFCLSTGFGDAYLLQAPSQIELENWIIAIHSACSSAFARQHGKEDTLRLLRDEIQKLETQIEMESKTKKMAELQLSTVTEPKNRQAIITQITQWEQNLEKIQLELYRLRCYASSLQATELPNPKTLLACVSRTTKVTLSRLGYFSVSSFHALVCARNPMGLEGRFTKPKAKKQKQTLFGTLKRKKHQPVSQQSSIDTSVKNDADYGEKDRMMDTPEPYNFEMNMGDDENDGESSTSDHSIDGSRIKILLPNEQSSMVLLRTGMTVQDLLVACCTNRQMDHHNFYIKYKVSLKGGATFSVPDKTSILEREKFDEIEICPKSIHQVELFKFTEDMDFGFKVEAELGDDMEQEDQLCVFISDIVKGGLAYHQDLQVGDELLVIDGRVVSDLDMIYIENLLHSATSITLTVRSSRSVFAQTRAMVDTNSYIDQMICPPPPSQTRLTDDHIDTLIVPAPLNFAEDTTPTGSRGGTPVFQNESLENNNVGASKEQEKISKLMKNAEQVTEFCRTRIPSETLDMNSANAADTIEDSGEAQAHKLRKVIMELMKTENAYVKDLNCLVTRYLEPLQAESFLSADEVDALFGNVREIIKFQSTFLKCLEESLEIVNDFKTLMSPPEFKHVLFSLGGCFLYYMDHFKLYSSFCACHSRAQKILDPKRCTPELSAFLEARNPKQQHSASLASYLIKPIQRVLKYPLLLQEMRSHVDPESDEYYHLSEALKGMESVAEHINDMMKVHEEFGDVFDTLVADQYHIKKEVSDLAMDDLMFYSKVTWLNCQEELGKVKKGKEPEVILFVFRLAVVIVLKELPKRRSRTMRMTQVTEDMVRFKYMIPTGMLQIKDNSIGDTSDFFSMFELVYMKSEGKPEKVFQFSCSSQDLKNKFFRTIRQTIRDFARGKHQGSAKYSHRSKNYIGYGGKRLEALGRNKRTLRKNFGSSLSSGRSEGSSLCSEERSSESGSLKDDRSDVDKFEVTETDSVSTGRNSMDSSVFGDKISNQSVDVNSNGNNGEIATNENGQFGEDMLETLSEDNTSQTNGDDVNEPLSPSFLTQYNSDGTWKKPPLRLFIQEIKKRSLKMNKEVNQNYSPDLEDIKNRLHELESSYNEENS